MSKVSSVDYPSYNSASVSIGDSNAAAGLTNGTLSSSYNMSDAERAIYDYAQGTLASILPKLNTFDTDTLASFQSQMDAYKNSGIQSINEMYSPMIASLENDVASRFGNLDNSVFMDNLDDIESKRSDAVSSFAQDVLAKQSSLEDEELNRRYNLVNLLSSLSNTTYDNALSAISAALGGSSTVNSYNSNLYNTLSKQSTNSGSDLSSAAGTLGSLLSSLGLA